MPLVDVTWHPGYRLRCDGFFVANTRQVLLSKFGPALPDLFVQYREELLLGDTPAAGVQVQHYQFGEYDINTAGLWVKVQFSEPSPDEDGRRRVCDSLFSRLTAWFIDHGYQSTRMISYSTSSGGLEVAVAHYGATS